jgi:hypothetical protein
MTGTASVYRRAVPQRQSDWEVNPPTNPPAGNSERTSSVITRLGREASGDDITIAEVMDALKDRSFGAMLILLAMPNAVAPGVVFVVGGPILLMGLQLALGYRRPWLPDFMLKRRLRGTTFKTLAFHAGRSLAWVEQWLRPRAAWLASRSAEKFLGVYIAGLAALLFTPLPLGSTPPAIAISLIAVGLAEKDGAAVALGLGVGLAGLLYAGAFVGGLAAAAISLMAN